MNVASRYFLLLTLLAIVSCEPEAPNLSHCERAIPESSLNATDREVLSAIIQNRGSNYLLSETIGASFGSIGELPYDVDSITIFRADERSLRGGSIGKKDFNMISVVTREHFNCVGATLNLDEWNGPRFMAVSLPGYNLDSTEALVNIQQGLYNGFSSTCEVYLEKQNGIWRMFSFPCAIP